jgi:hypothetical protein
MIDHIWLYPPLAFARLGPSVAPCDSFQRGPNNLRPRGTGKSTIQPDDTLHVAEDGRVTASVPASIRFKDAAGFKPICPFFELHGRWTVDGRGFSGPLTPQVLAQFGLTAADLQWRIEVANLKPYHYTLNTDDRIAAELSLRGNDTQRRVLAGVSPVGAAAPLVVPGRSIPLGSVQLTRPTLTFPEFRLRFTPPAGLIYGPTNLNERLAALIQRFPETEWRDFAIPVARLLLNPQAAWCNFNTSEARTNPGGLYVIEDDSGISLGIVDDVSDGIIRCIVPGVDHPAYARIVVAPPDYAPDRRPFTSLADGLTDRVRRHDVRAPAYVEDEEMTTLELRDWMERVLETMSLMNVDYQNLRARRENAAIAQDLGLPPEEAEGRAFPPMPPVLGRPLPLTEYGRQRHRRFVSLEVFEDLLRETPALLQEWIREPMTGERYYDRKMPALMRGSDRYPMHITRRQYDLLRAWVNRLRQQAEGGS